MLISIECQDAVGTLDRIKVVASLGELGEAAWEGNALALPDANGKVSFVPHLDLAPKLPSETAREVIRFETPAPHVTYRERSLADRLQALIYALLINDGLKPERFTITIATQ